MKNLNNNEIVKMFTEGKTTVQIASLFNVSRPTIANRLHKNNINTPREGRKFTEETKNKMSKSWQYEKHFNEQTKKKISESIQRCYSNPIFRNKVAEANRKRLSREDVRQKLSITLKGRLSPMKGRKHKPESKLRLLTTIKNNPNFGMKGKKHSEESKIKIGLAGKGRIPYNKGMLMSEEHKIKLKISRRKFIKNHPEIIQQTTQKILQMIHSKPNKTEQKLIIFLQSLNLPYQFVGDGTVMIGNLNPDFISIDGSKKIIELFGEYWHTVKANKETKTEAGRIKYFNQFGFSTLIIWSKEIKDKNILANKILSFHNEKNN